MLRKVYFKNFIVQIINKNVIKIIYSEIQKEKKKL